MKIISKFLNKYSHLSQGKEMSKRFLILGTRLFSNKIEFDDDGNLSEKYYKFDQIPIKLSEFLNQSTQSLEKIIQEQNNILGTTSQLIFKSKEDEEKFLKNKNIKFSIPNKVYKSFLDKGMLGRAVKLQYKNLEVFIIGTIYERVDVLNIYKMLNYIKPDMIMLQMRPDRILSKIDKYYHRGDKELVKKLIRDPWEVQPSLKAKKNIKNLLLKNGFAISSNKLMNENVIQEQEQYELQPLHSERLTEQAISMIALWGEQKDIQIMISDMPELILIEKLANSLTLLQIRNIFDEVFREFPLNPDWEPRTTIGTAINLFPEIFVHHSDAFLAHSINTYAEMNGKENKKLVIFAGYGQTESLPLFLNYDMDRNSLMEVCKVPQRYVTFIQGEDSLEILAEKWCLLSLIINGNNYKLSETTSLFIDYLINKYARDDMIKTGFNSMNHLTSRTRFLFDKLYSDKTEEALKLVGDGYEIKKKNFIRKIFNDPLLNSQLL